MRFLNRAGQTLMWAKHPATGHFSRISEGKVPSPPTWFTSLGPNESWEFEYHGGNSPDEASTLSVHVYGSDPKYGYLSFFRLCLPLLWFATHSGHFIDLVLEFSRFLTPVHGYGGLGIVESPRRVIRQRYAPMVYEIVQRFPGLDVDSPTSHIIFLTDGIKGVNWITILSDRWINELGGLNTVRSKLSTDIEFYPYSGGILIRAGAQPQLGDQNLDRRPPLYVQLSSVLAPIRVKEHGAFQNSGRGMRLDRANSEKWLARFD